MRAPGLNWFRLPLSIWSLFITLVMGLVFLTLQIYDYTQLPFGADDTIFGTTFYTLTGFHGVHVTGGILMLVLGVVFLTNPALSLASLTLLLAVYFVTIGIVRSFQALAMRYDSWGWGLASGVVTLILGILIWAQWPVSSLYIIGLFVGIVLLVAAAFLGPGTITTASTAGAAHGFQLLWALVFGIASFGIALHWACLIVAAVVAADLRLHDGDVVPELRELVHALLAADAHHGVPPIEAVADHVLPELPGRPDDADLCRSRRPLRSPVCCIHRCFAAHYVAPSRLCRG